jgi:hypothetical protein
MTSVLSVRMPRRNLDALDRRAAAVGVDRSTLVNRILEEALARCPPLPRRRFASAHLVGKYSAGRGSSNAAIRTAFRSRPREANR